MLDELIRNKPSISVTTRRDPAAAQKRKIKPRLSWRSQHLAATPSNTQPAQLRINEDGLRKKEKKQKRRNRLVGNFWPPSTRISCPIESWEGRPEEHVTMREQRETLEQTWKKKTRESACTPEMDRARERRTSVTLLPPHYPWHFTSWCERTRFQVNSLIDTSTTPVGWPAINNLLLGSYCTK
jgi:hypothetical protein